MGLALGDRARRLAARLPRGSTTHNSLGISGHIERKKSNAGASKSSSKPSRTGRLAKLRTGRELSLRDLGPTTRATILKLTNKGWIERGAAIGTYRITSLGEEAVRAQLPLQSKHPANR